MPTRYLVCLIYCLAYCANAHPTSPSSAAAGFSISAGKTESEQSFSRLAFRLPWGKQWFTQGAWSLTGQWEASVLYLDSYSDITHDFYTGAKDSLYGFSLSPTFRLQRERTSLGIAPFVELGIGAAYFSETWLRSHTSTGSDYGSHFQFEDKLAFGFHFGKLAQYELQYNYIHYSNANIKAPNYGVDSHTLGFSYWFK